MAKFLVPIPAPLTINEFAAANFYEFTECILSNDNADRYFVASFVADSLFTNVSLRKTIDIYLGSLYVDRSSTIIAFGKALFRTLIELAIFIFYLFLTVSCISRQKGLTWADL